MRKRVYNLYKKYPKIFAHCFPEVGHGWYWILDNLCSQLQWDIDRNGYPQVQFTTVKQKFGSLRIYSDATPEQYGAIKLAQLLSESVCENCGDNKTAEIRDSLYLRCLCSKCWMEAIVGDPLPEKKITLILTYYYIVVKQWVRRKLRL